MSWVCSNCSSTNADDKTLCTVCGAAHPVSSEEPTVVEGKIVFSDFAVWKENRKNFFKGVASIPKKVKKLFKRSPKPRTETEAPTRKKRERSEKPKKVKSSFAKPWAEHNIKFDVDAIKAKGFVRSEQTTMGTVKGYTFYKPDGTNQFIKVEMLIVLRLAKKI